MNRTNRRRVRLRLPAPVTKLAVAVAVFTVTLTAGSAAADFIRDHRALPSSDPAGGRCSLWLIGSSSIHRWNSAAALFPGWRVNNRGVEGALLTDLRQRLAQTDRETPPAAAIFYAGENDIASGLDGAAAARDMLALVAELKPHLAGAPLFVVSMKPSPTRWGNRAEQLRYDAIVGAAAPHAGFTFLPVGNRLLRDGRPGDFYRPDGVHLSERGYRFWGGAIRDDVVATSRMSAMDDCRRHRPATA